MDDTQRISLPDAEALILAALTANGASEPVGHSVARALVAAEAEGQVGHGFSRVEDYVAQLRSGKINAGAQIKVDHPNRTTVLVDADHGFAFPALDAAIEAGAGLAAEFGTAAMMVTRSHHCGALSLQVDRLARRGLVAMMFANTPAAIAPWGASVPVFGTNPIAFAVPRPGRAPLVIDLSLSQVARGKVMHAKKSGQPIPEGWALDREGRPTTDPEAALAGSMVPIGGAKGTALALMVEILAAVMTGAATSAEATSFFVAEGQPPGVGQFLMAIDPPMASGFGERLEALLTTISSMDGARLPGERRLLALRSAEQDGIVVPRRYLDGVRALSAGRG